MNLLVKTINSDDVAKLRVVFEKIDTDGSGTISAQELSNYLFNHNQNVSKTEVQNIINQIEYQGEEKIHYREFLAATISVSDFLTEHRLLAIFCDFDTSGNKKITPENLVIAF
jgi:calcium-dependent protein kinase